MKIGFSLEARKDLVRLKEFISIKNPKAATQIATELIKGIDHLTEYSDMGKPVKQAPEPDALRDIFILDYHIRYLKLSKDIIIVRIWHQKENR